MIRVIFPMLCFEVSISVDNIYRNIAIFVSLIEEEFLRKLVEVFDLHHAIGQLQVVTLRYQATVLTNYLALQADWTFFSRRFLVQNHLVTSVGLSFTFCTRVTLADRAA